MRGTIRLAVFALLAVAGSASAQSPDYKAELAKWNAQHDLLRTRAHSALAAETAREKAGDCPQAVTTLDIRTCLTSEIAKTQANYDNFAAAIRAMLAMPNPAAPGEQPVPGPTGLPASTNELLAEFDSARRPASKAFREHAANAAYDEYKSGTPSRLSSKCRQYSGWSGFICRNSPSFMRKNLPTADWPMLGVAGHAASSRAVCK